MLGRQPSAKKNKRRKRKRRKFNLKTEDKEIPKLREKKIPQIEDTHSADRIDES